MPAARHTGLEVLGDVPWGTHLCLFYETAKDLLEILLPFFRAGLSLNEHCIWILSRNDPFTKEQAWIAMERFLKRKRQFLRGQVDILSYDQFFVDGKSLKIDYAADRLEACLRQVLASGKEGIRLGIGSAWLLNSPGQEVEGIDLHVFEHTLERQIARQPILALCNFPIKKTTAANLLDAAHAHHFALTRQKGSWKSIQVASAYSRQQKLTERELEALSLTAKGMSAREAAETMHVSKRTVDAHIQNSVTKLGAANKTQAVALALLRHVIEL
jgi:DNA-binding CsgD family transcriptional regulator